jgi:hypothetical protein
MGRPSPSALSASRTFASPGHYDLHQQRRLLRVWDVLNSPFVIFVLSSLAVAGLTKYWDVRQAQRHEARENYRYVLECISRVDYVLDTLPTSDLISLMDYWSATNAFDGSRENTTYQSLFKDFNEQRIDALVTLLAMRDSKQRSRYIHLLESSQALRDVTDGLELVEKREEVEKEHGGDLEGLAQLWTFWELPPDRVEELKRLKHAYTEDLAFLQSMRGSMEKRL